MDIGGEGQDPASYSFTVKNEGDKPVDATLYVQFPGMPQRAHPLGTLKPHQNAQVNGVRPNVAGPGQTVRHTDYAWVYAAAVYGPDPKVAERLRARNLSPDDVYVANPLKPTVAKLLDLMTRGTSNDDTKANETAVQALRDANERGQLPLLAAIAASGRLTNTKDLADNVSKANTPGNARVLEQVAHLMKTDPNAKVIYDGPYEVGGKEYKTDYMLITSEGGQDIKRAFQVKTVTSERNLKKRVRDGGEQLNGEGMGPGGVKAEAESAPPGFERVLQINLEPNIGDLFLATTADLERSLSSRKFAAVRQNLCKEDGSGVRVDRFVIVNSAGTHQWTDLSKLGVRCSKATPATS